MANPEHLANLKKCLADPGHLAILKKGVEAWNGWCGDHPEIIPDLSGASLQHAVLRGINLSGTS